MSTQNDEITETEEDTPSLSRVERRREAEAYAVLAAELARGRPADLPNPPFEGALRQGVLDARSLAKSARSRQIRRLAKLLQSAAPIEQLRAALEGRDHCAMARQALETMTETWRAQLLGEGDPALARFIAEHPGADRTRLRKLMRQARRTTQDPRAKRAATALFRELRGLIEARQDE